MMEASEATTLGKVGAVVKGIPDAAGSIADNWISVPSWYTLISIIGLKPGGWLQRIAQREFDASK